MLFDRQLQTLPFNVCPSFCVWLKGVGSFVNHSVVTSGNLLYELITRLVLEFLWCPEVAKESVMVYLLTMIHSPVSEYCQWSPVNRIIEWQRVAFKSRSWSQLLPFSAIYRHTLAIWWLSGGGDQFVLKIVNKLVNSIGARSSINYDGTYQNQFDRKALSHPLDSHRLWCYLMIADLEHPLHLSTFPVFSRLSVRYSLSPSLSFINSDDIKYHGQ